MRSAALATALLAGALAATGCGSSGSSSTSGSATAGGPSSTASSTQAARTQGSRLEFTGSPRYASPSPSQPIESGTVKIAYRNITIAPDTLRVRQGSTVRWTNYDPVEHNVTSESGPQRFSSGNFAEGGAFQVTLTKPGTYHYECTIHPATMNGTIEVVR
jgi:plastocyanin